MENHSEYRAAEARRQRDARRRRNFTAMMARHWQYLLAALDSPRITPKRRAALHVAAARVRSRRLLRAIEVCPLVVHARSRNARPAARRTSSSTTRTTRAAGARAPGRPDDGPSPLLANRSLPSGRRP